MHRPDSHLVADAVEAYPQKKTAVKKSALVEVQFTDLCGEIFKLSENRVSSDVKLSCLKFLKTYIDEYLCVLKPTDVSADGEDGLIIEWRLADRYIDLNWPDATLSEPYLYFSTPDSFGVKKPLTAKHLRDRLDWVQSEANG